MSVFIHPKDSGPIDTSDRGKCNGCGRVVRVKGKTVYRDVSPGRRRTRPWHTTHLETCPYCKAPVDFQNIRGLRHRDCDTVFPELRVINGGRADRESLCPSCKEPVTEENTVVLSE